MPLPEKPPLTELAESSLKSHVRQNFLRCDFNDSGTAFTTVEGDPLPPCRADADIVLVERNAVIRVCCDEHADLARDEHPEASEYAVTAVAEAA